MNEKLKLEKISNYKIPDLFEDMHLNSITNLVSLICDVPICLISLLDIDRKLFKSKIGLTVSETDRNIAFCEYTIKNYDIFEVENTLLDSRFISNPLVKGYPSIRFYAGMPLTSPEGYNIGTLCIIDTKPRKLNNTERLLLETLAKDIINHFELLSSRNTTRSLNEKTDREMFLGNVSHELRTPLNAVHGFTELMLETKMDDKQVEYVNTIKMSIENMIKLINQLLDINKLENGKFKLENYLFDFHHNMKYIFDIFHQDANKKGLKFNFKIDEKIPKLLKGDGIRLNQILINLISNAIKFTKKGSVSCNISLSEENEKESIIKFSVVDTGIGIHENKLNKLFIRYEQLHENNFKNFGGYGLGLNITNNLVKLLGSKLYVNSIYGTGSEFNFIVKFLKNIELSKPTNLNYDQLKGKRVLVCDDTEINIKLIQKFVEKFEMEIESAENGKIGIEKLKNGKFDFVLMDINMPELNGYETTNYIRNKMFSSIPIIGITANNNELDRITCLNNGMNGYLSKPFQYIDLYNIFCNTQLELNNIKNTKTLKIKKCFGRQLKNLNNNHDLYNINQIDKIDLDILKEYSGNDYDLEKNIISKLIDQYPINIKRLQNEIDNNNFIEIKLIAHKLKSIVKMFGLNKLYISFVQIEKFCFLKNKKQMYKEYFKIIKLPIVNQLKVILRDIYGTSQI